MPVEFLISALVTLLVVVDPLGLVPSFIAITEACRTKRGAVWRCAPAHRRRRSCAGTALAGAWLLRTLVDLAAGLPHRRRAAAVFDRLAKWCSACASRGSRARPRKPIEEHVRNIAAFPLAIPLMAGPGRDHRDRAARRPRRRRPAAARGAARRHRRRDASLCFVVFLLRRAIAKLLGITGNVVLSRLLGVLLAALAVQFVVDGVRAALAG